VRIIAGTYGGRILAAPADRSIRPAMDRVRGTIFNMLQNRIALDGASVLDLFAGSGSLGFECLSRGAARCLFVDSDEQALAIIRRNAELLACADRCDIVADDAQAFLSRAGGRYHLCFADPPYAYEATGGLPGLVSASGVLAPGALLIIEHTRKLRFAPAPGFAEIARKEFGSTVVTFFSHHAKESDR